MCRRSLEWHRCGPLENRNAPFRRHRLCRTPTPIRNLLRAAHSIPQSMFEYMCIRIMNTTSLFTRLDAFTNCGNYEQKWWTVYTEAIDGSDDRQTAGHDAQQLDEEVLSVRRERLVHLYLWELKNIRAACIDLEKTTRVSNHFNVLCFHTFPKYVLYCIGCGSKSFSPKKFKI